MGSLYPQIFFETPGMTAVFVTVIIMETTSLGLLLLVAYEFRKMRGRHATLFNAIDDGGQHKNAERVSRIIFWIYIISTFAVTILTLSLFIFQPHII